VITHLDFSERSTPGNPTTHWIRSRAFLVALIVHTVVIGALIRAQRAHVLHLGIAPQQQGIGAFISPGTPVGTTGTSKSVAKKTPAPEKAPQNPMPATEPATELAGSANAAGSGGGQVGGAMGPVRLGSGQGLGLLKKVEPVYPPTMQAARMEGSVVLDAVIHRDGTVGDVRVLKSSGPLFERAAIDAVKQWLYAPIPYEGLLTLTVNFNLR